ncbi:aldehyde dehydrogenase family protein [Nocardia mangyaensis]|uniref:aldehyde dehydrogenase family protein n=1 Tax=Nocardia mangyaensis TaxID=2213200 RepID=UPI0026760276|nr:aldehyde dehydrogenase family protein [Nocardia mangyaensis]MDO3647898.1 aldehyde dehydrogenase family protein [Nocardia mangyaensis]
MTETPTTASISATMVSTVNPATGEPVGTWAVDDAASVATAVGRARAAAQTWSELGFTERKRALLRWAAGIVNNIDEFCELIKAENGKPLEDAYLEVITAVEHLNWAADNAPKVLKPKKVFPGLMMANHEAVIEQRPHGVVGVIGPWNYPVYTPNGSIAYALAAGNTVVFKPSELTLGVGHWFADAFAKANPALPQGILSVVSGDGETGRALVESDVDMIAFTGSTATGKKIMAAAAQRLTPVVLECGGKDAAIIAEDADVAAAADAVVWSAIANSGQTCVGTERCYVVNSVIDEFVAEVTKRVAELTPGSGPDAAYGPMTLPAQVDVVSSHVEDALAKGAKAVFGGRESIQAPFVRPIVLLDVPEDSLAVEEETFGPTLTIRGVRDVEEAIRLSNASRYGLASTVFSRKRGMEIARQLRVGATSVNSPAAYAAIPALPFGGVGESGVGRIHGAAGLLGFTRPHSIARQRFVIPGMALLSFSRTASTMSLVRKLTARRFGRAK